MDYNKELYNLSNEFEGSEQEWLSAVDVADDMSRKEHPNGEGDDYKRSFLYNLRNVISGYSTTQGRTKKGIFARLGASVLARVFSDKFIKNLYEKQQERKRNRKNKQL